GELDVAHDSAVWAAGAVGRSEIQVEDRHRLPAYPRDEVLRLRIDDDVGKGDALAAVPEGQPPGVINGSGERRYDDLAAADREKQCRLGSCRGNGGEGDTGMLEGRRYRRIDDDIGALTDDCRLTRTVRRLTRGVLGRGRRARSRAAGYHGAAARGVAARTAAGGYDEPRSHDRSDG